jgi:hypothetical protein
MLFSSAALGSPIVADGTSCNIDTVFAVVVVVVDMVADAVDLSPALFIVLLMLLQALFSSTAFGAPFVAAGTYCYIDAVVNAADVDVDFNVEVAPTIVVAVVVVLAAVVIGVVSVAAAVAAFDVITIVTLVFAFAPVCLPNLKSCSLSESLHTFGNWNNYIS